MDIRNIKIEAPGLSKGHLEFLYEKGEQQLIEYKKIDNYGEYPLDINTRHSQAILKDFIGRIIEELFEGYESLEDVVCVLESKGFNVGKLVNSEYRDVLNCLQNANEEQADALGFFISTFLFCNIQPDDIYSYVKSAMGRSVNELNELLSYGASKLYLKDVLDNTNSHNKYSLITPEYIGILYGIDHPSQQEEKVKHIREYTPGFNRILTDELEYQRNQLWFVVYELNKARNLLKNRPWKQTEVMTKELELQESLVKSFLYYLGYLADRGFDQDDIVTLFNRKQALNLWRINSGY